MDVQRTFTSQTKRNLRKPMTRRALIGVLQRDGFVRTRGAGRNLVFQLPSKPGHVAVPRGSGDIRKEMVCRILLGATAILGHELGI